MCQSRFPGVLTCAFSSSSETFPAKTESHISAMFSAESMQKYFADKEKVLVVKKRIANCRYLRLQKIARKKLGDQPGKRTDNKVPEIRKSGYQNICHHLKVNPQYRAEEEEEADGGDRCSDVRCRRDQKNPEKRH